MDPKTGHVKAYVGGINLDFKYDHVTKGKRQVGSTFKPFICIGYSRRLLLYEVPNIPVFFDKERWGLEKDWILKTQEMSLKTN